MSRRRPFLFALALGAICAGLSGCGSVVDADQAGLCERVAAALHPDGTRLSRSAFAPAGNGASGVRLTYVAREPEEAFSRPGVVLCLFAAPAGAGRLDLTAVETADGGMDDSQLFILKRWWLDQGAGADAAQAPAPWVSLPLGPAFGLQQGLNALGPAALFAALATAFTLIHGLTGRIVLAVGEIAVTGGAALLVYASLAQQSGSLTLAHVGLGILAAVLTGALWAWAMGRFVLWPFQHRRGGGQGVLIASIGLALVLREALTLRQIGAAEWLPPLLHQPVPLAGTPAFTATTTPAHLMTVVLTGGAVAAAVLLLRLTPFGRAWRAMADDPGMAALCGVSPRALLGITCAMSGALCGLAGAMMVVSFGSVDAGLGLPLTLKALAAAVLGGVGSVGGAALGGVVVAALEMLWSSAFDIAYRDVVMYALLIVALVARPQGLLGAAPRDV